MQCASLDSRNRLDKNRQKCNIDMQESQKSNIIRETEQPVFCISKLCKYTFIEFYSFNIFINSI